MKVIYTRKGEEIQVDDEDYERLNQHEWKVYSDKDGYKTVRTSIYNYEENPGRTHVILHQLLLGKAPQGFFQDHIDRNPLNNQRGNFRLATPSESARNRKARADKVASIYKGVRKGYKGSFAVYIGLNNEEIYVGKYGDEVSAGIAYNHAAAKHHGEFAVFNDIPNWQEIKVDPEPRKNAATEKYIVLTKEGKYKVQIRQNKVSHYLGVHKTLEEAITVRDTFLAITHE